MITNVKASRYEHITLFGQPALFTDERIARDAVPDGWYCYDLRGRDDDPMVPAAVEKHVFCNHAGSVLCPAQLELGEDEYRELGDEPEGGLDFYGEELSFEEFCRDRNLAAAVSECLYTVDNMYLHVQRCEEGFDYTFYDRETKREIDGGHMDFGASDMKDAALEICKFHELGGAVPLRPADIAILDSLLNEEVSALKDIHSRQTDRYVLRPAIDRNAHFYYGATEDLDFRRGCIGHVRMDFGQSGNEFWHNWFPRSPQEWHTGTVTHGKGIGRLPEAVFSRTR